MGIEDLRHIHSSRWGQIHLKLWSPGRINLIGEHTDYNHGYVLPSAIDAGITILVTFAPENDRWELYSHNLNQYSSFGRRDAKLPPNNFGKYLQALVDMLEKEEGITIPGFMVSLHSTIPPGGGLSSSAALTIGFIMAINHYGTHKWSLKKMASLAQCTEHQIGANVGIMDPYAIVAGRKDYFTLINCRTNDIEAIPANLGGYVLLLIDTGISHNLAESEYNVRRASCEVVLEKSRLYREVLDVSDLNREDLDRVQKRHPEVSVREVVYVLEENRRVLMAVDALRNQRMENLGRLMCQSHAGLRDQYRVSCEELDYLVDCSLKYGVAGARMMGGGFGGSTINLIRQSDLETFKNGIREDYRREFERDVRFLEVHPADGARVMKYRNS